MGLRWPSTWMPLLALALARKWTAWIMDRWFGWLVERAEHLGNREKMERPARGAMGGLLTLFLLALAGLIGLAMQLVLPNDWVGFVLMALLASSLIAARLLHDHVADVSSAFEGAGIDVARCTLSRIVGRETASDEGRHRSSRYREPC